MKELVSPQAFNKILLGILNNYYGDDTLADEKSINLEVVIQIEAAILEELPKPTLLTPWKNAKELPEHQYQKGRNAALNEVKNIVERKDK